MYDEYILLTHYLWPDIENKNRFEQKQIQMEIESRCDSITLVACHTNKRRVNKTVTIEYPTFNVETPIKTPSNQKQSSHVPLLWTSNIPRSRPTNNLLCTPFDRQNFGTRKGKERPAATFSFLGFSVRSFRL